MIGCKNMRVWFLISLTRQYINDTIRNCIQDATNYASDFSIQALKIALVFSTHEFKSVNGAVTLRHSQGSGIAEVLPDGYTPTIITNEYNSSQTCVFCFEKLSHPTYNSSNSIRAT
ncbi:unnamed protein product [Mucor fragilis]